jgi:hypothetical protein
MDQFDYDEDSAAGRTTLPDVDVKTQQARLAYWQKVMTELDALDAKQLSPRCRSQLRASIATRSPR